MRIHLGMLGFNLLHFLTLVKVLKHFLIWFLSHALALVASPKMKLTTIITCLILLKLVNFDVTWANKIR
jgi:hypothetical protein